MRSTRLRGAAVRAAIALAAIAATAWLAPRLWPCPPELLSPPAASQPFLDRHGRLLRDVPLQGTHQVPVPLDRVPAVYRAAVILAEDRRFLSHPGVDGLAIARAAWQDLQAGRIVSGASTITQQYVRGVLPIPRTLAGKLREAWLARVVETRLSKDEILSRYLDRLPFGHGITGIGAAARWYLGKDVSALDPAEAALLAVVPRAPALLDPLRPGDRVRARARDLVRRMADAGILDPVARDAALARDPRPRVPAPPFLAPHATTALLPGPRAPGADAPALPPDPSGNAIRTSLDLDVQRAAEQALRDHLARLGRSDVTNGAVVVADATTGEILALVGSRDFHDDDAGQVNGADAPRQPGSTLKPFLYALAFDSGFVPSSPVADAPATFAAGGGTWSPRDHDRRFRGPVRLREALASSLNLPAARLLDALGVGRFLDLLRALGFRDLAGTPDEYGLGLVLGDAPVRLAALVAAYGDLARGGEHRPASLVPGGADGPRQRVFTRKAAFLVADVLSDRHARALTFGPGGPLALPFPAAVKTGTSADHRDSWCVAFTPDRVVGVWVGNMGGASMGDLWGAQGAAPIAREVLLRLYRDRLPAAFEPPAGLVRHEVCPLSGGAPGPACPGSVPDWFPADAPLPVPCARHALVDVDLRNGLRAGPGCPPAHVLARPAFVPDPATRPFAAQAGLDPAPDAWSPLCPGPASPGARILRPRDGEEYQIDPDTPAGSRTLGLVAATEGPGPVRWIVDGRPGPVCVPDRPCRWPLAPGAHTFAVATDPGRTVRIRVVGAPR